jgi:hypothetical protein
MAEEYEKGREHERSRIISELEDELIAMEKEGCKDEEFNTLVWVIQRLRAMK